MSDEEWVKAAMADDAMVVELLIRLNDAPPPKRFSPSPAPILGWSVRQRRSKQMVYGKKSTERASPTTPLSWSGATSLSGGGGVGTVADGLEEFSRTSAPPPKWSDTTRSELTTTSEPTASTKRSRKKKTLAELKEEELLLVKERRHLKRELVNLHAALEKQRATNESFKRLKLDFQLQPVAERIQTVPSDEAISDQTQQKTASCSPIPSISSVSFTTNDIDDASKPTSLPLDSPGTQKTMKQENKFILPDLNIPFEEVLHGLS